jgi:hypothetical protein
VHDELYKQGKTNKEIAKIVIRHLEIMEMIFNTNGKTNRL